MKPARRYCRYSKVVCVGVRDRSGGWKRWRVKPGINQGYGGEEKPALVFAQTKPNSGTQPKSKSSAVWRAGKLQIVTMTGISLSLVRF